MKKGRLITIIIFALMILVTTFVLIKTDLPSKIFNVKAAITIEDTEAMFISGKKVNAKMKTLVGNGDKAYTSNDSSIKKIQRSLSITSAHKKDDYKEIGRAHV